MVPKWMAEWHSMELKAITLQQWFGQPPSAWGSARLKQMKWQIYTLCLPLLPKGIYFLLSPLTGFRLGSIFPLTISHAVLLVKYIWNQCWWNTYLNYFCLIYWDCEYNLVYNFNGHKWKFLSFVGYGNKYYDK